MKAAIKGFRTDSDVSEMLKALVDSLGESISTVCNECIRLGGPLLVEKHRREEQGRKRAIDRVRQQVARN